MVETVTAHYGWTKPEVTKSFSTWGGFLNGDLDSIDAQLWSINTQVQAHSINISRGPDGSFYGDIRFQNNGNTQLRWRLGETSEAEGSGNTGSNFVLDAFDNSGAYLGNAFEALRGTQTVAFAKAVTVGGSLSVGGSLLVSGVLNANAGLNVVGNVNATALFANSSIFPCYGSATDWYLTQSGSYRLNNWTANWADRWNTTTGMRDWTGPSGVLMSLDGNGILTVANNVSAPSLTTTQGAINVVKGSATNPAIYLNDNTGNKAAFFYGVSTQQVSMTHLASNCNLTLDGVQNFTFSGSANAFKSGGGTWSAISDARIKNVTGEYEGGLEEVLRLRPITYTYKGNDASPGEASLHQHVNGKQFIGFVAQEAELVMPEMVSMHDGYVDGRKVGDLRSVDTTALIYALVNSVKELKAEIEALKAR